MIQRTHTFPIDYTSNEDGERYSGSFTVKKLSIMDLSRMRMRTAQLSGGMHCVTDDNGNATGQGIDSNTEFFNSMLSQLEVSIVIAPPWWKFDDMSDVELVRQVYKEVEKFEQTFRNRGRAGANGAVVGAGGGGAGGHGAGGAEGGGTGLAQANAGGRAQAVVGAQVLAALE